MPPPLILDPSTIDCSHVIADGPAIEKVNPHRYEMNHLSAVVLMNTTDHIIAGYKDVGRDEFWVRGHFPEAPILPGVIQCEAAAQLLCYYATVNKVMTGFILGLGGLENARFRRPVRPGDRLVIVGKGIRVHRRQTIFTAQGFVGNSLAFHCDVIGVPITSLDSTE
jgi:3-hydroxyacyl-[acyl-carrier-protein] dehydratase